MKKDIEILRQHYKWYYKHKAKDVLIDNTNLELLSIDIDERLTLLEEGGWGWGCLKPLINISSETVSNLVHIKKNNPNKLSYTISFKNNIIITTYTKEMFNRNWTIENNSQLWNDKLTIKSYPN